MQPGLAARQSIGIPIAFFERGKGAGAVYLRLQAAGCVALVCFVSPLTLLWAQAGQAAKSGADRSIPLPTSVTPPPMTVGQKFRYRLKHSFDLEHIARCVAGAALDQARDHPSDWGRGWDSFGVRVTSHLGQHLIREQIMFGVEALDHETPGHIRSSRTGFTNRLKDAVKYTFVSSSDSGRMMPAYSRFVGAYGAGYISRAWYPPEFHTVSSGFYTGTESLGIDVGMNVLREFYPDIKKKIFHRP
jgi:hypothetical protein